MTEFVVFACAVQRGSKGRDQVFALPVDLMRHVMPMPSAVTPIAAPHPAIAGVFNWQGHIVTALDTAILLNTNPSSGVLGLEPGTHLRAAPWTSESSPMDPGEKRCAPYSHCLLLDFQGDLYGLGIDALDRGGAVDVCGALARDAVPSSLDPALQRVAAFLFTWRDRLGVALDPVLLLQPPEPGAESVFRCMR